MCHRNVYTQECMQDSIKEFEFGGYMLEGCGGGVGGVVWGGV